MRTLINALKITLLTAGLLAQDIYADVFSAEVESGELLGNYASVIHTPFMGVALFANGDGIRLDMVNASAALLPGNYELQIFGASSNQTPAQVNIFWGAMSIGTATFTGEMPASITVAFRVKNPPAENIITIQLDSDSGQNDIYVDRLTLKRTGDLDPIQAAPSLPDQGSFFSNHYRNMFAELGYTQDQIQSRVNTIYQQLFHSDDLENEALFIPVGNDMAYIWDTGNNDVRSEGMSYGMMMAVQMDRQDDFNRLWQWAHTFSRNTTGEMKGYYAWQVTTDGQIRDKNPAPDGEEYFVTALFFAAHRWGNGEGIFNYQEQANKLLDDMYANGETRYANNGILENISLFNHNELQIVFSPATPTDRNWTDPSYHLPAFYELWARWAENNNDFWRALATQSRDFFQKTVHPETGLSPDYAYFDGTPHGDFQFWKNSFQYDAWRTIGNAAMDYAWWQADPWQIDYANRLQRFFAAQGIENYPSLYELDGTVYENNRDHSPGLVAMNAMASLASNQQLAWDFINELWNTPTPTGKYRYYDGCLYMFAFLALSGNYKIYCPENQCTEPATTSSQSNHSSSANSQSSLSANLNSSSSQSASSTPISRPTLALGAVNLIALILPLMLLIFRHAFNRNNKR